MTDGRTAITFAPRSTTNCLDLAAMYCGRELPLLLTLWFCIAAPSCALVYLSTYYFGSDVRMALAVLFWATAASGGWLIAIVAPQTVGDVAPSSGDVHSKRSTVIPPGLLDVAAGLLFAGLIVAVFWTDGLSSYVSPRAMIAAALLLGLVLLLRGDQHLKEASSVGGSGWPVVSSVLAARAVAFIGPALWLFSTGGWVIFAGAVLTLVPGLWALVRWGFVAERVALRRLQRAYHDGRTEELIKNEGGDLFIRGGGIALFFVAAWLVFFLTADAIISVLFQTPIFMGNLMESGADGLWRLAVSDQRVLTLATATALLAYPVARLAWFLCYIDLRIRRDCWDMELGLAEEARRLDASQPRNASQP